LARHDLYVNAIVSAYPFCAYMKKINLSY